MIGHASAALFCWFCNALQPPVLCLDSWSFAVLDKHFCLDSYVFKLGSRTRAHCGGANNFYVHSKHN